MKGYIYISRTGTDSKAGAYLNDPIFGNPPTLGACMPNIRRNVMVGDKVYVVSGSVKGVQQYIVGGFEVKEKINALAAYRRFPEYRLQLDENGNKCGNIIVDASGKQHSLDDHKNFKNRLDNYLVGHNPISCETDQEVELARNRTLTLVEGLFEKRGNRVIDVMGRWHSLNSKQMDMIDGWLKDIKQAAN